MCGSIYTWFIWHESLKIVWIRFYSYHEISLLSYISLCPCIMTSTPYMLRPYQYGYIWVIDYKKAFVLVLVKLWNSFVASRHIVIINTYRLIYIHVNIHTHFHIIHLQTQYLLVNHEKLRMLNDIKLIKFMRLKLKTIKRSYNSMNSSSRLWSIAGSYKENRKLAQ